MHVELNFDFWRKRRVLLTGHSGFKGAWLSLFLETLEVDLLGISLKPNTEPNLFDILAPWPNLTSATVDIRNRQALADIISSYQPEIVIHFAAQPLVRESYNTPLETIETNVMGTVNLLEVLRSAQNLQAVLIITSDKVYENNKCNTIMTESSPLGGHDPYSASKAATEILVASYAKSFFNERSIPVCTARAGNVLGGGDWAKDRLVPDLWRAFENGSTVELRYPHAVRPWQHVFDPLYGYLLYIQQMISNANIPKSLNFAPPISPLSTVADIAQCFQDNLNATNLWKAASNPLGPKESDFLAIDATLATKHLNWTAKLIGNAVINWTCEWYKAYNSNQNMRMFSKQQIKTYFELLNLGSAATLAVIGGGRWGRVHLSIIAKMQLPFATIVIVSKHNQQAIAEFMIKQNSAYKFELVDSIEILLDKYKVHSAIVANAAFQHFDSAVRLIDHKVNVLIEKPIVQSLDQANILFEKALRKRVCISPGLNYRFCSYIHNFAKLIKPYLATMNGFLLEWQDASSELRYGEAKSFDASINVAADVMPHVWTILAIMFHKLPINVVACNVSHEGHRAEFSATADSITGRIILQRKAQQRRRKIVIFLNHGENLSLDFTIEPGTISIGKQSICADENWGSAASPLQQQLSHFVSTAFNAAVTPQQDIDACLASVHFSKQAADLYIEATVLS